MSVGPSMSFISMPRADSYQLASAAGPSLMKRIGDAKLFGGQSLNETTPPSTNYGTEANGIFVPYTEENMNGTGAEFTATQDGLKYDIEQDSNSNSITVTRQSDSQSVELLNASFELLPDGENVKVTVNGSPLSKLFDSNSSGAAPSTPTSIW
jgi:hypothetical protein